jgi:hypothetical protein
MTARRKSSLPWSNAFYLILISMLFPDGGKGNPAQVELTNAKVVMLHW